MLAHAETLQESARIRLRSTGGDPVIAMAIGRVIRDKGLTLKLDGACMSSCAEFLLPAARRIEFGPNALVGFHQSPELMRDIARRDNIWDDVPLCGSTATAEDARAYREEMGVDPEFWRTTQSRLGTVNMKMSLDAGRGCANMHGHYAHSWWFPGSDVLRDDFGINGEGTVCADSASCRKRAREKLEELDPQFATVRFD